MLCLLLWEGKEVSPGQHSLVPSQMRPAPVGWLLVGLGSCSQGWLGWVGGREALLGGDANSAVGQAPEMGTRPGGGEGSMASALGLGFWSPEMPGDARIHQRPKAREGSASGKSPGPGTSGMGQGARGGVPCGSEGSWGGEAGARWAFSPGQPGSTVGLVGAGVWSEQPGPLVSALVGAGGRTRAV